MPGLEPVDKKAKNSAGHNVGGLQGCWIFPGIGQCTHLGSGGTRINDRDRNTTRIPVFLGIGTQ